VRGLVAGLFAVALSSCGSSDCDTVPAPQMFAVVSAFPAELALLVERAAIEEEVTIEGRLFRRGELGGVPVVLALTGVGLVNASTTTRLLLDNFPVTSVVFSGVAGSPLRIGDVAVPVTWEADDDTRFPVDPQLLELAEQVAARGVALERCTIPPSNPERGEVCMPFQPVVAVGGFGQSSDPFNNRPYPCTPGGNDVFGCDLVATPAAGGFAAHPQGAQLEEEPTAVDMETAAVAREAAARGIPHIAFRAVSDGAEDPLMLPGFPAQFFTYYRLAGRNAALATIAFLEHAGGGGRRARQAGAAPLSGCSAGAAGAAPALLRAARGQDG
jgi:nucleoside phosphorylase